jgi:predicted transcriptional regulator
MKPQSKAPSQSRWRTGRVSIRVHSDLKEALEFLADTDRRTLSQYIELICLDHVKALLRNEFDNDGALASNQKKELVLRDPRRR